MSDDADDADKPGPMYVTCNTHGGGRCIAAVVCTHQVNGDPASPVGWVENSSDPDDLQAWCHACERMFLQEDGHTDAFMQFCSFGVVCRDCYYELKAKHDRLGRA